MSPERITGAKSIAIVLIAVTLSIVVVSPQASGDILGQGVFKLSQSVTSPPVVVTPPGVCYKGATFAWNYSMVNDTMSGTLRIHVNFNVTSNTEFWNVLELLNPGNMTGNFTMKIIQYAKMGSDYYLNDTYTDSVSVYINHYWQSSGNPGVRLYNNTVAGPFDLYPSSMTSYYFGIIYTAPEYPPHTSDYNSFGEYVDFFIQFTL